MDGIWVIYLEAHTVADRKEDLSFPQLGLIQADI
jgi:hypothetical protein